MCHHPYPTGLTLFETRTHFKGEGKIPALNRFIIWLFFCSALFVVATLGIRPFPLIFIIKAIPVLSLALLVFKDLSGLKGRLIGIGLLFSGLGDVLLELDRINYFTFGLAAFLIAHLFYTVAFFRDVRLKNPRNLVILPIILYGVLIETLIYPNLNEMFIPVTAYVLVIMIMGISASIGSSNDYRVIIGACLFIFSDSIIAIDKFVVPVPSSRVWIMIAYFSAQFLIATGSLKGKG